MNLTTIAIAGAMYLNQSYTGIEATSSQNNFISACNPAVGDLSNRGSLSSIGPLALPPEKRKVPRRQHAKVEYVPPELWVRYELAGKAETKRIRDFLKRNSCNKSHIL